MPPDSEHAAGIAASMTASMQRAWQHADQCSQQISTIALQMSTIDNRPTMFASIKTTVHE